MLNPMRFSREQQTLLIGTDSEDEIEIFHRPPGTRYFGQKPISWIFHISIYLMIHCLFLLCGGLSAYCIFQNKPHREVFVLSSFMITWMLATNFLALLTPLVDTIQRKCRVARVSPSVIHLQIMLGGAFGSWIGMLIFCYRPITQPKLFTCVALVCTICGLMLDVMMTIFIGEMAGLIQIPQFDNISWLDH